MSTLGFHSSRESPMMPCEPVEKDSLSGDGIATKVDELGEGEGSETDIELHAGAESEESSLLPGWNHPNRLALSGHGLLQKAMKAKVPLIISIHFLVFNLILAIALGSLLVQNSTSGQPTASDAPKTSHLPGELLYTIGEDVIEYRVEQAYVGPGYSEGWVPSAYQGWPTDENDALWRKYEDGNHIRLTKEEASHLLHETEHVPMDEHKDEYLVGLVVFHQLHCLSALRRAFYPRRYNTSLFAADGRVDYARWHHVDHCLEVLRAHLECHPETTAMAFRWVPDSTLAVHPTTLHTCRNFDVLSQWAYDRAVPDVPIRAHVEDGRVVDYSGRPFGREYNETWVMETPANFVYTKDDMV